MSKYYEDTIASIATTVSNGAISIIRVSGKDSIEIVSKIFKGKELSSLSANTITYGHIIYKNELLDEVLVSVFKGPKSFTAEDTIEINCHGGVYVTNRVLEALLSSGARLAEPGEFTKRAFLNGRIDLTQAEAVMDVINANSKNALKVANYSLRGDIYKLINELRNKLLTIISKIEVNIDYPEYEDEEQITDEVLKPRLLELIKEINYILQRSESCMIIKNGIDTAIIGKPNVGKSTILNKLLREDKAIVTNIAGTTRDTIEGKVNIGGITLNLIDTAGMHETNDYVEKIGVEKSKKALNDADLVIFVLDNSRELDEDDEKILNLTQDKKRIIVVNKSDLASKIDLNKLKDYIYISTENETDILALEDKIKEVCDIENLNKNGNDVSLNNARQISKLKQSLESLKDAEKGIYDMMPIDMINIDLHIAWEKLGEITGSVSSDDLINELFSKFCLGK